MTNHIEILKAQAQKGDKQAIAILVELGILHPSVQVAA